MNTSDLQKEDLTDPGLRKSPSGNARERMVEREAVRHPCQMQNGVFDGPRTRINKEAPFVASPNSTVHAASTLAQPTQHRSPHPTMYGKYGVEYTFSVPEGNSLSHPAILHLFTPTSLRQARQYRIILWMARKSQVGDWTTNQTVGWYCVLR